MNHATALKLYQAMSKISEEETHAGWHSGTEYSLWERLDDFPELKELSDQCKGWIVWVDDDDRLRSCSEILDDGAGPALIPIDKWVAHYSEDLI